jgi:hypothetical protein
LVVFVQIPIDQEFMIHGFPIRAASKADFQNGVKPPHSKKSSQVSGRLHAEGVKCNSQGQAQRRPGSRTKMF